MKFKFLDMEESYDGSQLASLRSYLKHGLLGDSIVSWIGACDISKLHMVDGEDLLANAEIKSQRMVHFIIEKFDCRLDYAVALQRLLADHVCDEVSARAKLPFKRCGDDVFLDKKKFSISIATVSPVSALIHFAVNVTTAGTPVPTCALEEWKISPKDFASAVMERFTVELKAIKEATQKVRWVK